MSYALFLILNFKFLIEKAVVILTKSRRLFQTVVCLESCLKIQFNRLNPNVVFVLLDVFVQRRMHSFAHQKVDIFTVFH